MKIKTNESTLKTAGKTESKPAPPNAAQRAVEPDLPPVTLRTEAPTPAPPAPRSSSAQQTWEQRLVEAKRPASMLTVLREALPTSDLEHVGNLKFHNDTCNAVGWGPLLEFVAEHMPNVQSLDLTDARMDADAFAEAIAPLQRLSSLRKLALDNAFWAAAGDDPQAEASALAAVSRLTHLQHLTLSHCGLADPAYLGNALGKLPLETLDIGDNALYGGERLDLSGLPRLKSLRLDNNEELTGCLGRLVLLPDLTTLEYSLPALESPDTRHLPNMPSLTKLQLDGGTLDARAIQLLMQCRHLISLRVRTSGIDVQAFEHCSPPETLRIIDLTGAYDLRGEDLSAAKLQRFAKAFPHIELAGLVRE